jgi:cytochrome c oxidase assembly factor CtaG/putative copper export protein
MTASLTHAPEAPGATSTRRWIGVAGITAVLVLFVALLLGGGAGAPAVAGLPDPGAVTRWGLPVAKLVLTAASVVTVGLLALAVMLPAPKGELGPDAVRALRAGSLAAVVWAAAAAVVSLLTLSDLIGQPLWEALSRDVIASYITSIAQGQAYAAVVVLSLALAPAARLTVGRGGSIAVLCLGIGTLVPPVLAGHSATGDYHHSATTSLLVHVVAMALWVGGLVAVMWYASGHGKYLGRVARSYSTLALSCFVAVGASGVLNAWIRLDDVADLVTTRYGVLVLGKVAALVALGWFGTVHRRRTLRQLDAGRASAFRRFAAGEVVVMAAAVALGVALSRTAPTAPDDLAAASFVRELLGYPIPPKPTPVRLLTQTYPDAMFALGCLAAVLLYLGAVWRLRRRGDHWPVGRTFGWLLGVGSIALVQLSGLMTYGMTMLSVHMAQHIALMMISPVLLVLGAPVTLALRALTPAHRGETGPREWLVAAMQSRVLRVLTHPVVALAIFVSGPFVVYFTGVFEYAMRNHTAHLLMSLHFLLAGYLFYEVLIGVDPLPKRPPYVARLGMQLGAVGIHAIFGLALMESARLIAADYYRQLGSEISWLPEPLPDQVLAGQLTWGFAELPGLLVLGVLFVQWYRSDERDARRFDRRDADSEAELAAYNAYLVRLDARSRGATAEDGKTGDGETEPPVRYTRQAPPTDR